MGSSEFSFTQDGGSMATILYIVLATVLTTAYSEATGDAQQYGYTPAPTPYGVEPVYQETPVYHATPVVAYATPVVAHAAPVVAHASHHVSTVHHAAHGVAHHGAAHHQSVVQHHAAPVHHVVHPAVVHHAPVHHAPAPYHEPKPDHYEPPKCSIDNPKTWCLEDPEYPTYEIEHALQYHYEGVQAIYKDVLANTENSVDRLKEIVQETYLCPSVTAYIQPLRAVNTDGKWRVVVNGVKAHYETLTQTARIEECTTAGESCPLVPACYETKCLQKSIYHRFLVYDAYDHYFPFAIETFKLPSACACYNGAYVEPPHKK